MNSRKAKSQLRFILVKYEQKLDQLNRVLTPIIKRMPPHIVAIIDEKRHLIDPNRMSEIAKANYFRYIKALDARGKLEDTIAALRLKLL